MILISFSAISLLILPLEKNFSFPSSVRNKRILLLILKILNIWEFEKYFLISDLKYCNIRSILLKKLWKRWQILLILEIKCNNDKRSSLQSYIWASLNIFSRFWKLSSKLVSSSKKIKNIFLNIFHYIQILLNSLIQTL